VAVLELAWKALPLEEVAEVAVLALAWKAVPLEEAAEVAVLALACKALPLEAVVGVAAMNLPLQPEAVEDKEAVLILYFQEAGVVELGLPIQEVEVVVVAVELPKVLWDGEGDALLSLFPEVVEVTGYSNDKAT
jgi:hypothetical protein